MKTDTIIPVAENYPLIPLKKEKSWWQKLKDRIQWAFNRFLWFSAGIVIATIYHSCS